MKTTPLTLNEFMGRYRATHLEEICGEMWYVSPGLNQEKDGYTHKPQYIVFELYGEPPANLTTEVVFAEIARCLAGDVPPKDSWLNGQVDGGEYLREYWKQKRRRMVDAWGVGVVNALIRTHLRPEAIAKLENKEVVKYFRPRFLRDDAKRVDIDRLK